MKILTSTLRDAAEAALDKGFSIFPLKPRSKHPATAHGFKDASALPAQIDAWWTEMPDANIGVACGESNLIVLDFDNGSLPEGFEFPETFTVKTSRGLHLYYWGKCRTADMYDASGRHIGEIKSIGGYILAAGSVHPNGPIYTAVKDVDVADAPKELLERLATKPISDSGPVSVVGDKIPYGQHDNELHRIAGRLRHDGLEEEAIFGALVEVCEKRCENYGADYLEMCRKHAHRICEKQAGAGLTLTLGGRDMETGLQVSEPLTPRVDAAKDWRTHFKKVSELEEGGVQMLIDGFLPEGTIFIGSLPGHGKTLLGLSLAKALTTGKPMFGQFNVPKKYPVLYLIPESSGRAFKSRLQKFEIPDDDSWFLCRTLSEGMTLFLDDPIVHEVVKQLHPVVILDTAIRFSTAADENSASQNQKLVNDMVKLRQMGAPAVVGFHHATKTSAKESMTLENALRGTGDFAAMCDATYAIRRDELLYDNGVGPIEIEVVCVKPRDFDPPLPFRLIAKYKTEDGRIVSTIDSTGDFTVRDFQAEQINLESAFIKEVVSNPGSTLDRLADVLKISRSAVDRLSKKLRYSKIKNGLWIHREDGNDA